MPSCRKREQARAQGATMTHVATAMTGGSRFVSELEGMHLHPLWDRYQRITPIKPQAPDAPFLWRWREIEPMLHRSVAEVSINDIERRALIMAHPAFGAETTTTSTMLAAFTVLDPGERARPHRHTGAAIRFATRAEGAVTIVDGRRGHADARLLCRTFGQGHDDAPKTRDVQRRVPGDRGRGPLEHRRGELRVVTARCLHHPALDVGAPRGARW